MPRFSRSSTCRNSEEIKKNAMTSGESSDGDMRDCTWRFLVWQRGSASGKIGTTMIIRDPEKNFEELWETFHHRYPFFELRKVDWRKQYDIYRSKVTSKTSDAELFDIFCRMLDPLDDGHVELKTKTSDGGKKRYFTAGKKPRFYQEFTKPQIKELFKTTEKTLVANGFGHLAETPAWIFRYCRSQTVGYMRILELEGIKKSKLTAALDKIALDFMDLQGFIIDVRDNPGGDDSTAVTIINRFCDRERVAFHRRTKIGPGEHAFTPLKTWHIKPEGDVQFTGPTVLLTCDAVFSGGEVFALTIRQLPHVMILGDHTNGIFSYQLEKKLPNGWEYCLSYQKYFSADMVCYEGKGVPADIKLFNSTADIEKGADPLITVALEVLKSKRPVA
jgi:carboxyl-terminal processing protease